MIWAVVTGAAVFFALSLFAVFVAGLFVTAGEASRAEREWMREQRLEQTRAAWGELHPPLDDWWAV